MEAEAEAEAMFFKMVEVEAEAEAISEQIGQLEAEAEAVQKSTASASLVITIDQSLISIRFLVANTKLLSLFQVGPSFGPLHWLDRLVVTELVFKEVTRAMPD